MTGDAARSVVVPLPQPTGRGLRLGPFPSAREALKFVTYAAVGGVVAGLLSPLAWLPFVGAGFVLSVYQPDGRALDRWFADYVRWRWRGRGGGAPFPPTDVRGALAHAPDGRLLAVLSAGGVPVAFLPPDEARRRFERYRELLRSVDDGVFLRVGVEPLLPAPFLPRSTGAVPPPERSATEGYDALVRAVCRRRFRRRVDVVLFAHTARPEELDRLEARVAAARRSLDGIGVVARRLRGAELARAAAMAGFAPVCPGDRR